MSSPQHLPAASPPVPKERKLTTLMLTNIIILSIVGIASILVMLFGEFDDKGIRVTSTFLVFSAFTAFTAWDSSERHPRQYLPIGQTGNIYMLGLSLIQIWVTLSPDWTTSSRRYYSSSEILWNVLAVIILVKIGVFLVQKISDYIGHQQSSLANAANISAWSFGLVTLLFTLPFGFNDIFTFGEGYWKISTAAILLAGLALSITVLLAWFFKDKTPVPAPVRNKVHGNAPHFSPQGVPVAQQETNTPSVPTSTPDFAPAPVPHPSVPQFNPPVASALAWPVFPSGLPLPAKANGRPDFDALAEVATVYAKAERQWFGQ